MKLLLAERAIDCQGEVDILFRHRTFGDRQGIPTRQIFGKLGHIPGICKSLLRYKGHGQHCMIESRIWGMG